MLQNLSMSAPRSQHAADAEWAAVLRRDARADGRFFYAVTSTGVFCRPSCPSRRPRRHNVQFFATTAAAEAAGFRACLRCHPTAVTPKTTMTAIRCASRYLAEHAEESVSLATLGRVAQLSPSHLQRQFKVALGVSPREYQAACRAERFRHALRAGRDVTRAVYEAGYGSPSRVYESAPTGRGMQPATYRRGGEGAEIGFITIRSALGWVLVAATAKGVCAVKLGDTAATLAAELKAEFPAARILEGHHVKRAWVSGIVASIKGTTRHLDLPLDVVGTAFQWRVWRALQGIPTGETRSYSAVAESIGKPTAARAVARACASNPVCLVVPCHRVVGKDGSLSGYRWGTARKARLLRGEKKRSKIPPV